MDGDEQAARPDAQERARAIIRGASVPAPPHLRARIEEMRTPAHPARAKGRRGFVAGGLAGAAIVVAVLLVLLVPGGAAGPAVAEAAALSRLPATAPAPAARPGSPALLTAELEGLAFPAWAAEFGWEATGTRSDEIGGRRAETVFYEKDGRRLAYTIVSGDGLPLTGDPAANREGVDFRLIDDGSSVSVVWERRGRTCVLTGSGTPASKLLDLAAWRGAGAVGF